MNLKQLIPMYGSFVPVNENIYYFRRIHTDKMKEEQIVTPKVRTMSPEMSQTDKFNARWYK